VSRQVLVQGESPITITCVSHMHSISPSCSFNYPKCTSTAPSTGTIIATADTRPCISTKEVAEDETGAVLPGGEEMIGC
jgi:hypothetical protein